MAVSVATKFDISYIYFYSILSRGGGGFNENRYIFVKMGHSLVLTLLL